MSPAVIAFVLVTGFATAPGSTHNSFLTIGGIANENECHKVALAIGAINHKCIPYEMAVPQANLADAVQDGIQDGDVVLQ
jgi:hypothetical protein